MYRFMYKAFASFVSFDEELDNAKDDLSIPDPIPFQCMHPDISSMKSTLNVTSRMKVRISICRTDLFMALHSEALT